MQPESAPSERADSAAISDLDAIALSRSFQSATLTPLQAVSDLLARTDRLDPSLGAYVEVFHDQALREAEEATVAWRSGRAIGPWHGVPIAVKDLVEIEGTACLAGAPSRRGLRSRQTATLVRRLQAQGMIVLGKTHTVEFAFGGWGTNAHFGTPRNPWDPDVHRTPGGSSSGSAVAVAARLAPWAIGTDTGGSVRTPSAFNNLTGLKTTHGRISVEGVVPLSPSLDTIGTMTRTVRDAAALFAVLLDPDSNAVGSNAGIATGSPDARAAMSVDMTLGAGLKGMRLARMPRRDRADCDSSVLRAYDDALEAMAQAGAEIVDVALPMALSEYTRRSAVMIGEAYALHGHLAADPDAPMDPAVRARILSGSMPVERYLEAQWGRERDARAFIDALGTADALVMPTTQTPPIPVADVDETTTPAMLTRFVNQLNLCALAVPAGFTAEGLPLSIQIVARPYQEAVALRIGNAWQQATDWHRRVAPMARAGA